MLALSKIYGIKKKAPQSANSNGAGVVCKGSPTRILFVAYHIGCVFQELLCALHSCWFLSQKPAQPVGVFRRKDFPHLPMPLQVREYLSMRTILSLCGHKVGRGWFPDSLSRAIKSTGQVNTGGRVEPHADSVLMGAYRKGNYCL